MPQSFALSGKAVNAEDVDSLKETAERTHAQQYQLGSSRKSTSSDLFAGIRVLLALHLLRSSKTFRHFISPCVKKCSVKRVPDISGEPCRISDV